MAAPGLLSAVDMTSEDGESDRERMITNAIVAVFLVVLVGAGLWLANAMVGLRKTQDCVLSGRKNCAPISVPGRGETW
jgi:hypothetical protein